MDMPKELLTYLLEFVTENKRQKMQEVLSQRTRHVTIALEDIYQPHNASAALRSCDLFGIQDVHLVENKYDFKAVSAISMGSAKWLDLYKYNSISSCVSTLKEKGYKVIATTPHTDACYLPDLKLGQKTALLFGTEKDGLTKEAMDLSDGFVKIPMFGFTESFNISVSVALCLYHVAHTLRSSDIEWQLSQQETQEIMLTWVRRVLKSSDVLEREFYKRGK